FNFGASLNVGGTFVNQGTVAILDPASALNFTGPLPSSGTTYLQQGTTNPETLVDGKLTVNAGAGQINIASGSLAGTGTIKGNVTIPGTPTNPGNIVAGDFGLGGTLTIQGNLTLTANGHFFMPVFGPTSPSGYSQLVSTGTVDLGGSNLDFFLVYPP